MVAHNTSNSGNIGRLKKKTYKTILALTSNEKQAYPDEVTQYYSFYLEKSPLVFKIKTVFIYPDFEFIRLVYVIIYHIA